MKKFIEKHNENNSIINYSLKKRFKTNINTDIFSDIILYSKIEIRGFKIIYNGIEYRKLKEVSFVVKI